MLFLVPHGGWQMADKAMSLIHNLISCTHATAGWRSGLIARANSVVNFVQDVAIFQ